MAVTKDIAQRRCLVHDAENCGECGQDAAHVGVACSRPKPHTGPCNGRRTNACFGDHFVPMAEAPASDAAHAKKMDMGKVPIFQGFLNYFPRAIIYVALISDYGKRKYAPDEPTFNSGWREVANGLLRYLDADARHMVKRCIPTLGEYDEESEMAHLAHKAWNAMAELERAILDGVVDVRVGVVIKDGVPQPGTSKKVDL